MNTLEIIREMRADPALAEELRAVVLDEELRRLPESLRELVEVSKRHEQRLDGIDAHLVSLDRSVAELVEVTKAHEQSLAELVEVSKRHDAHLVSLDRSVAELVEVSKRHDEHLVALDRRVGRLTGSDFEAQWCKKAPAYLGSRGFRKVRYVEVADVADLADGLFDDEARDDLLAADGVHSAVSKADGKSVYVVCEVSSRIHRDDVSRALRRAGHIARLGEAEGVACVAGASIDDLAAAEAETAGVIVVTPAAWAGYEDLEEDTS